jgi:hypothetical protein
MKKYEYMTSSIKLTDNQLNDLGNLGWKLISHSAVANNYDFKQYYVFMREKAEN